MLSIWASGEFFAGPIPGICRLRDTSHFGRVFNFRPRKKKAYPRGLFAAALTAHRLFIWPIIPQQAFRVIILRF